MSTKDTGGPAFPMPETDRNPESTGMTLRDYFAAKAMQAYCGDPSYRIDCDMQETANAAYDMADAMLKARAQ